MVVDDHPQICELIRLTLAPLQAELLEAATADSGLALACAKRPHVIILDVQLPGALNGFDVCRRIKTDPELAQSKVIIVTTQSQGSALLASEASRADVFLTKPFSPRALLDTVQEFFRAAVPGEIQRHIS